MAISPPIIARAVSLLPNSEHAVLADQAGTTGHGSALFAASANPGSAAVVIRGPSVLLDCQNAQGRSVTQVAQDGSISVGGSPLAAYKPIIRQQYISDGSGTTLPDTSSAWAAVMGFSLAIPASVGNYVDIGVHGMRTNTVTAFLDVSVLVGSSLVRFLGTGTSSPLGEGDPGWYFNNGFTNQSAPRGFVVESGDLSAGHVVFVIAANTSAAAGSVESSTTYTFFWRAINWGAVDFA